VDGWQTQWDCQAAPDGAATLSLSVFDASGRELLHEAGQMAVTLSKNCSEGSYRAAFFANTALTGSPTSSWCKASAISYNWGAGSPGAGISGGDNFSARFRGNFRFGGGAYRFKVQADDGMRLWIDRVLVLNEWRDHSMATGSFEVTRVLTTGLHEVWLDYYERSDAAGVVLGWELTYGAMGDGPYEVFLPLVR
jgi:hypothetical protein